MNEPATWSRQDLQEARLLQKMLGEMLGANPFTQESMRAVTHLCDRAMVSIDDEYCQEMFSHLDRLARRLHRTGTRNRYMIRMALDAIDHRLGSLETLRGAGNTVARAQAVLAKY